MKVHELLKLMPTKGELPVVEGKATIDEVVHVMTRVRLRRIVYVVDEQGRYRGVISLGELIRHVFKYHRHLMDPLVLSSSIMAAVTSETAEDIMTPRGPTARLDEEVHQAIDRMLAENIKEMPIVDESEQIVGDLDMLDVLELWLSGQVKGI